jgi:hypothetical protein
MTHFLRILTSTTLAAGIMLTVGNSLLYTKAEATGQGATVALHPAATSMIKAPKVPLPIVPQYENTNAGDELVIGILLIVLGFFFHALTRTREEREVHITVKPSEKKRRPLFWMEMHV